MMKRNSFSPFEQIKMLQLNETVFNEVHLSMAVKIAILSLAKQSESQKNSFVFFSSSIDNIIALISALQCNRFRRFQNKFGHQQVADGNDLWVMASSAVMWWCWWPSRWRRLWLKLRFTSICGLEKPSVVRNGCAVPMDSRTKKLTWPIRFIESCNDTKLIVNAGFH